ncbi:nicotinate-nucleotide--dimethylbenzimidazole phosphoribosyltransferase [Streptomyces sp. SMS_SU21]|uniref:nicotinate-nucleotide--dimethylbenzimidazole phosphoribosyltransferase n=1 Tax=Streptomyces sp. SMS_SU21 TaxID=2069440 RepID=UPI000D65C87D|nr:nicotinate-nucleotide--dimethylbenzimidazole phosphoribosyltransferase [Streptomyces sp. SMS_SU21]MCA2204208.1 nicotinate-nucleotide--dimethylbenzimidazole phosphoribosyltransferase [Streptomyces sp. SMS_SU21]
MTDTGQVPGEGLPENAGRVEQPGVATPDAYTYLSDSPAEDEDLLLPGAQGAWGNEIAPPAPAPVVETVHQPGPHETDGRDSGSVDLGGVRPPEPEQPAPAPAPSPAPAAPRRPLHLGPPLPDLSASPVRSLADRGPADLPARQPGPPTLGPEYLDVPQAREAAAPQAAPWVAQGAAAPAAQAVDAAQAAVARVATQAVGTAVAAEGEQTPAAAYGEQGTPVVPGPGAPGDATAGGDAGAPTPTDVAPGEATEAAQQAGVPVAPEVVADGTVTPDAGQAPGAAATGPGESQDAPAAEAADADAPVPSLEDAEAAQEPQAPQAEAPLAPEAEQDTGETVVVPEQAPALESVVADGQDDASQEAAAAETAAPRTTEPQATDAQATDAQATDAQVAAEETAGAPDAGAQEAPAVAAGTAVPDAVPVPEAPEAAPVPDAAAAQDAQTPGAPATEAPGLAEPAAQTPVTPESPQPAPEAEAVVAEHAAEAAPAPEAPVTSEPAPAAAGTEDAPEPQAVAVAEPQATPGPQAAGEPVPASEPVQGPQQTPAHATPLPGTLPLEPEADQPLGQFVPVDGSVPSAPHLAPTPPQGVTVPGETAPEGAPAEAPAATTADVPEAAPEAAPAPAGDQVPAAVVPPAPAAPAEAEVAQNADDLDTQGAGVEPEPAPRAEPAGPAAPGYADAEREAVLKVMRERRDIRNGFRSDPIPHEVLLRVLEAAHTAPSVGHSQPWDFVVIRSEETRRRMHELATRQREAYAKTLPKGRAKQFKELKIEAILDTPVNIVVTADPTRGGRHTLGRHTQPQMAPYSSALAVENLWLAARAEGLGVGWVSFFDEREMVRALDLPDHLEVVAYLCVGYVDEFPDEPELMQAGWSKRRPLSWVVHEETYGRRALPGEDPHDLLAETVAQIRPLDAKALGEAWERQKRMTKPAGALGMLEIISAQLSGLSRQCPPPIPEPAAVAIFAGDHGVHAQGVTPWPQEVTAQMVANFLGGGAVCNAFAAQVGAEVCVVDVGVSSDLPATPGLLPRKIRAGTSDMTAGPAMTREEAKQAIEVGIETARDLVAAGNKALLTGEMGIANTTASAALISVYTGADPAEVTGRGTGINDETLARKTDVVRRALELHQPDPSDPLGVLAAVGGFEHAAMVGLLLGGASLRTPVILDGVSAGAAALVARAIAPEVLAACIAGHRSAEPGHVAALNKLGLRPLVDLDLRLGEGTGALLALPLVQSTARAMHEVATFDSAGVTEK